MLSLVVGGEEYLRAFSASEWEEFRKWGVKTLSGDRMHRCLTGYRGWLGKESGQRPLYSEDQ